MLRAISLRESWMREIRTSGLTRERAPNGPSLLYNSSSSSTSFWPAGQSRLVPSIAVFRLQTAPTATVKDRGRGRGRLKEEQTTRSVGSSPAREVKRETGGKTATRRDDEFDHCHEFIQRSATTHRDLVGHVFYLLLR